MSYGVPMFISPDREEDDWTEFLYMKEGTYYWAKTAELNAFLNPSAPVSTVAEPETESSSSGQLLTPDPSQSISFMNVMGDDAYESIDTPTQIEVLDPKYPDGLEGWENVEVKNLDSGQVGYINCTDLQKYLSAE